VKKVLVTGASGFCGQHLCRYLVRKRYKVIGTYHEHHPVRGKRTSHLFFVPLDITDFSQVVSLLGRLKPHFIFHLAAQSIPRISWKLESRTFEINTLGTIHLLEAVRRVVPECSMLFASSIQVYGRTFREGKPVREADLLWPESPYAASKAVAEVACLHYYERFGVKTVIGRAFNHLGQGQSLQFVFSDWCRQIALAEQGRRKPVLEVGNLDAYRDFLHVQDVVEAYELLLRRGGPGTIYNICEGRTRLLKEYIDFLLKKSLIPMKIEIQKKRLRRYDPPVMKGNASRLRALGWRPIRSPFQALEELLNEWRSKV
jgi:GDP-4-dehydro-6-deoxy-D-mannose reductase